LGALTGAVGAGIASAVGGALPNKLGYQLVGRVVSGAVACGISAELYGGKFWEGFANGAATAASEFLFNFILHEGFIEFNQFPWLKGPSAPLQTGALAALPAAVGAGVVEIAVVGGTLVYIAPGAASLVLQVGTIYVAGNPAAINAFIDFCYNATPVPPTPVSPWGLGSFIGSWIYNQLYGR
jgi:hypothetical protein